MTGIVNSTGARSGVIGTTVGSFDLTTATFPAGHVIQTVAESTTSGTTIIGGLTSYTSITGMTADITPQFSNSKILIMFHCGGMVSKVLGSMYLKVTGTTTGDVMIQSRYGYYSAVPASGTWIPVPIAVVTFDTPGTVAEQTYQLHAKTQASPTNAQWYFNTTEVGNTKGGSMILQEIKV